MKLEINEYNKRENLRYLEAFPDKITHLNFIGKYVSDAPYLCSKLKNLRVLEYTKGLFNYDALSYLSAIPYTFPYWFRIQELRFVECHLTLNSFNHDFQITPGKVTFINSETSWGTRIQENFSFIQDLKARWPETPLEIIYE